MCLPTKIEFIRYWLNLNQANHYRSKAILLKFWWSEEFECNFSENFLVIDRPRREEFFLVLFILFFVLAGKVNAQKLSLTPNSGSFTVGEIFTVELMIDTEGQEVVASDAKISFNNSQVELIGINRGDFFDEVTNYAGESSILIGGFFNDQFKKKSGTGKIAAITFKGKTAATTSLSFVCSAGKFDESNIISDSGQDIIKCASLVNGSYTLQGGSPQPTSTPPAPTPTSSNSTPPVATPTLEPPRSGIVQATLLPALSGILMLLVGGGFLLR